MRRALAVALLSVALVPAGGCGASTEDPARGWEEVTTPDVAIVASVPTGIGSVVLSRNPPPLVGEGILFVREDDSLPLQLWASVTALEELAGTDFDRPEMTEFSFLIHVIGDLPAVVPIDGCESTSERPIQGGEFYGTITEWRQRGSGAVCRVTIAALRADRTLVVTVEARLASASASVAAAVLDRLRVDPARIPHVVNQLSTTVIRR